MAGFQVTSLSLIELLHKMESGGILTPDFNRGFVWKKAEIKSLFESVYSGYPIGIILAAIGVYDDYAPSLPESSNFPIQKNTFNSSGPILWVIDGSQRLAALYGVLRGGGVDVDLYFDLIEKEFLYSPKEKNRFATIKMSSLFDYKAFMVFQDSLVASDLRGKLISEVNVLHAKFQSYQVVLQVIDGAFRDEVANVFARINMSGRSLSKDEVEKVKKYNRQYKLQR
ncbi:DUF262 domain-containing protein [Pseudomonas sp. CC120222-01a]|uniref:DUF262 domain-containing protein n=1 Tax=Pseudomonas sp. CC120222-01a TaxID=1378075 RepID=UPI000D961816|nr:DUF262 domain-containing protein [Pseudomonas sp. CC120222-01a]PVZ41320.1 uncharacterized protein DUF262 [Pseudomonas sp. CC120222-01a]